MFFKRERKWNFFFENLEKKILNLCIKKDKGLRKKNMKRFFIDFDGVILDTQKSAILLKKTYPNMTWEEFSRKIDWGQYLNNAKIINSSITIIKKIQNKLNISIITKTNSLKEQEYKINYLRKKGIKCPIYLLPPNIWKNDIIIPTKDDILIDDNKDNIKSWIKMGGKGIFFNDDTLKGKRVDNLKFLENIVGDYSEGKLREIIFKEI